MADAAQREIFASKDLPELRTFVHKLNQEKERNFGLDPILSENSYLDDNDLIALEKETGVKPFQFYQKAGDAVFVPAGCAHQVKNITGFTKCVYDFLSPETMKESGIVTSQFQDIKLEDIPYIGDGSTFIRYPWSRKL